MSTSRPDSTAFEEASILVVGVGGLGCPAAMALARAGVGRLVLVDDDTVDVTNLHRQVLFSEDDVGKDKLDAAAKALAAFGATRVDCIRSRLLPDNARDLVRRADIVVEGADNFATKFLTADACRLERRPVVHGSAVRFRATTWAVSGDGRPCYRCLFEDILPAEAAPNCAEAGVMGPVAGLAGAMMADLALRVLASAPCFGRVHTYDGIVDSVRSVEVSPRPSCPLCGQQTIFDIDETRYTGAVCAA